VFGSGFIAPAESNDEKFIRPVNIYALRGKSSKKRCENILRKQLDVPLGDFGLLANRMFDVSKIKKQYEIGIICHIEDKNSKHLNSIQLGDKSVKYIDIQQEPKEFVKQVAQCNFILSSAMHGLICADSLGIPNKHIILSNKVKGGEYKFRDYYSIFPSFKYKPTYLQNTAITPKDIKKYTAEYSITPEEINKVCDDLDNVLTQYRQSLQDRGR
jgi:hypothetical protein